MSNVTYILGAGASYHAIPTVESMNKRMLLFLNMFKDYIKILDNGDSFALNEVFNRHSRENLKLPELYEDYRIRDQIEKFREIIEEACRHKTVDTYAKKLWLQKNKSKLYKLKQFLSLYFSFEQSSYPEKLLIGDPFDHQEFKKYVEEEENIKTILDYRYDVFLATLLNENMELPENVNIISWNYDHQLELAYMDYAQCNMDEAKMNLNIHPHLNSKNGKIIKLNGSANQFLNKDGQYHNFQFHQSQSFFSDTLHYVFGDKKTGIKSALKFAWEKDEFQTSIERNLGQIIAESKILIIIGYSFPNFNSYLDTLIFSDFTNIDEIRVQCLKKDYNIIEQRLFDLVNQPEIHKKIKFHDDLDQFYIPVNKIRKI